MISLIPIPSTEVGEDGQPKFHIFPNGQENFHLWADQEANGGVDPEFDICDVDDGPIATALRGRTPGTWVLHGTTAYSRAALETDPETSASRLVEAWGHRLETTETPSWFRAHRWRFARALPETRMFRPLVDPDAALAVAGDAFGGGDAQGAWLSGESAAARLRDALFARSR